MYKKLKHYFKKKYYLTIYSNIEENEENYEGYIVDINSDFVCLYIIEDWHNDGYVILPIKYITSVRCKKHEKVFHKVLKLEGVTTKVFKPDWLNIHNYNSIFKTLQKNKNNIIIESRIPSIDEFVIGKIVKIKKRKVYLKAFDATGQWLCGLYKVPYDEISLIKFDDEYSSVFRKYIDNKL